MTVHAAHSRDLYSAPSVNTGSDQSRTGRGAPDRAENSRDTPRLYALYSFVFRCHLHTFSSSQPYCRKGFGICIQCIQRIPTPFVFRLSLLLEPEYMNTVNTPAGTVCPVRIGAAWARRSTGGSFGVGALGSGAGMTAILYSAALVNTRRHHRRSGARTPKSGRIARDTPRLYALYSVVFRCRMHTNSARKPYSRKGFQICIQCIQRIPTPFVFAFSLLLGREYMNTANTSGRSERRHGMIRRRWSMATAVRHRDDAPEPSPRWMRPRYPDKTAGCIQRPGEYTPQSVWNGARTPKNTPNLPRHAPVVCIVFSCIQMPNAYKFRP